ncbi:hypothetical protein AMAG_20128 [Allomyces macrogynus ATCC 38327]|uniref:Uncharacterized protein n=1 Tax=Allomyces macrogynus (strain ATCC 38327) TaxID=578462 RepID=A0A0L0T550_ALLM3|nr:hypothetical protein AMAG_20128 [Allomyces macrogynus ATCC 38327]|eukprot:KNE69867.1 hypothetical protein AMAG_20128 [Allomyces macrogynus ATCC 38327]
MPVCYQVRLRVLADDAADRASFTATIPLAACHVASVDRFRRQIAIAICPQFVATIDALDLGYLDESGVFFSIDSDSALRLAIAMFADECAHEPTSESPFVLDLLARPAPGRSHVDDLSPAAGPSPRPTARTERASLPGHLQLTTVPSRDSAGRLMHSQSLFHCEPVTPNTAHDLLNKWNGEDQGLQRLWGHQTIKPPQV